MKDKLLSAFIIVLLAIMSMALLTGCGSGDVALKGRLVENGTGLSDMWIILADKHDTGDGYIGYRVKLSESYLPLHPWSKTGPDGSWQINIPEEKAKGLGSTVLVVTPAGKKMEAGGSYIDIRASGLREFAFQVRSGAAMGQAIRKNGNPIEWGPGKLRGTVNLGDIRVER